jgi:hypothetical protein
MILNIVSDFLPPKTPPNASSTCSRGPPPVLWSGFRPWLHPVSLAPLVIFSCEMESQQRVVT